MMIKERAHSIKRFVCFYSLVIGILSTFNSVAAETIPPHLLWADTMVQNVSLEKNAYAAGTSASYMRWPNDSGVGSYENFTKCSPFVTLLLMKSYGWTNATFTNWMASSSPTTEKYFDTINKQVGFLKINAVTSIKPGDIITVKYPPGSSVSGHMMIASSVAYTRAATSPIVNGTYQYEIQVVDSSKSGHGKTDTRYKPDGTFNQGAGIGVLRLYANSSALLVGHTWSTYSNSTFYSTGVRPITIGRLNP